MLQCISGSQSKKSISTQFSIVLQTSFGKKTTEGSTVGRVGFIIRNRINKNAAGTNFLLAKMITNITTKAKAAYFKPSSYKSFVAAATSFVQAKDAVFKGLGHI